MDKLIERLKEWKGLPDYQMERRVDLFISLYLEEVLNAKYVCEDMKIVCPEFPVRALKIIGSGKKWENPELSLDDIKPVCTRHSTKIDYLCYSAEINSLYLVELKTDSASFEIKQLCYYKYYINRSSWKDMWNFVLKCAKGAKSGAWQKYAYMLYVIDRKVPALSPYVCSNQYEPLKDGSLTSDSLKSIRNVPFVPHMPSRKIDYIYIAPEDMVFPERMDKKRRITLKEFAEAITQKSKFANEFRKVLCEWNKK